MKTSDTGIALIKEFEGCELTAYPDPGTRGEPYTIGYGHTGGVPADMTITQEEADAFLRSDLEKFERCVSLSAPGVNQRQFDACVCLAFNIGCSAFGKSTLARKIAQGDMSGAADEFLRWNKAGGRVMAGLTRRREAERAMFLS